MGLKAYLERIALGVERLAVAQERVANHLDRQEKESALFKAFVEETIVESTENGYDQTPLDMVDPTVVDWFVDTNQKDRPIMVRLSDGSARRPTEEEAKKLG
jgi:hypothetical protein